MTTEAGGGVSQELRERLALVVMPLAEQSHMRKMALDKVDAILAEIAASGYELVERDRWLRVHAAAWWAHVHAHHPYLVAVTRGDLEVDVLPSIESGDLDRGEGS
jgi:hypothetical protein